MTDAGARGRASCTGSSPNIKCAATARDNHRQSDGGVGRLSQELQHFAYRDLAHHHATMDRYTTLAADEMFEAGRRAGVVDLVLYPPAAFLRNYLLRRGVLDGVPGLIISAMNAHYVFLKFAKLWERSRPARGAGD